MKRSDETERTYGLEGPDRIAVTEREPVPPEGEPAPARPVATPPPVRPVRPWRAIAAIIIAVVVIAAAFGAWALMNQGGLNVPGGDEGGSIPDETVPESTVPNQTTPEDANGIVPDTVLPGGPAGTVNGTWVDSASIGPDATVDAAGSGMASWPPYQQLSEDMNFTSVDQGSPDSLVRAAVTNNQAENMTLRYSGFTAFLADGSSASTLNDAEVILAPGETIFVTLGFLTNGQGISSLSYSDEGISFSMPYGAASASSGAPASIPAPTGLTPNTEIAFESPGAWRAAEDDNTVVALVTATNNNPSAAALAPSDFWIDLGNGTWVQADSGIINNVPATLQPGQSVPFWVGFSGVEGATPQAMIYWPGGSEMERFGLNIEQTTAAGPTTQLYKIWTVGAADPARQEVVMQFLTNAKGISSVNMENFKVYTLNGGTYNGLVEEYTTNLPDCPDVGTAEVTFDIPKGDAVTMVSYEQNGQTHYVLLR